MSTTEIELDDIQSGALHERPSPYVGTYLLLRIDDREAGRELVRRLVPLVDSGVPSDQPEDDTWITVAFSYQGLRALGVPDESLESFSAEFKQGMGARAAELGDIGESSPEHWEAPFGTGEVHLALAVLSPDAVNLAEVLARADRAFAELPGIAMIWRQDCYQLPTGRTSLGFKDGIGQPAVEGSGVAGTNPNERPIKAGEFVLGYADETGDLPPMPTPDVLGRNGTYIVVRKLQTRVGAYRQFVRKRSATRDDEALLNAKIVGRWQSGAPLSVTPDEDDQALGGDRLRNNDFQYGDDGRGLRCPLGAHARRGNPRDSLDGEGSVDVRLHRMIRRGTSYGPMLPEGELDDDGVDRGIMFVCVCTHLHRQFEFVKTTWLNDGIFIGAPSERDPLVGLNDGTGTFTIPTQPIRRRIQGVPPFVVTRGGEYFFVPGLRALRWLSDLAT